jgi:pimeloyl-ACP methyl ester carboxylesterase
VPYADNEGIKIHFEVEGKGAPLLLQHGFSATLDAWITNGFVAALSPEYRLILLDARGRGDSGKPHDREAYTFQKMVSDLVAVLNQLHIEKAHYLGYSMGGAIGLRIPLYAADRFHSLILGGATYPMGDAEIGGFFEDLAPVYDGLVQAVNEGRQDAMAICVALFEKSQGPMTPERKARALAQDPRALAAAWEARKASVSPPADEYLSHFSLPCLFYVGERDPRLPGAKQTARKIPGAQFFSLPGLNHSQTNARGDLVIPEVRKFLFSSFTKGRGIA